MLKSLYYDEPGDPAISRTITGQRLAKALARPITGQWLAKAQFNSRMRARLAAEWVSGELEVKPTVKAAVAIFGVSRRSSVRHSPIWERPPARVSARPPPRRRTATVTVTATVMATTSSSTTTCRSSRTPTIFGRTCPMTSVRRSFASMRLPFGRRSTPSRREVTRRPARMRGAIFARRSNNRCPKLNTRPRPNGARPPV